MKKIVLWVIVLLVIMQIAFASQKIVSSENDFISGTFSSIQLNVVPSATVCNYRYISSGYDFFTSGVHNCAAGECNASGICYFECLTGTPISLGSDWWRDDSGFFYNEGSPVCRTTELYWAKNDAGAMAWNSGCTGANNVLYHVATCTGGCASGWQWPHYTYWTEKYSQGGLDFGNNVGGSRLLEGTAYWSNTEYNAQNAFGAYYTNPSLYNAGFPNDKSWTNRRVRCVKDD